MSFRKKVEKYITLVGTAEEEGVMKRKGRREKFNERKLTGKSPR